MRRSIIALGALITAVSIFHMTGPASAEIDYPVCRSVGGGEGYTMRCDFSTFEQCQATVSGIGGSCIMNPWYNNSTANVRYPARTRRVR
jgi:hypothetical protein